ncbi:MAG: hypothetical protein ACKVWR_12560 [Acidimicrobiales bacterium]
MTEHEERSRPSETGAGEAAPASRISPETREHEQRAEHHKEHEPGRAPSEAEAATADRLAEDQPDVAEDYREMTELGAQAKGEGRV